MGVVYSAYDQELIAKSRLRSFILSDNKIQSCGLGFCERHKRSPESLLPTSFMSTKLVK